MKKWWIVLGVLLFLIVAACNKKGQVMDGDGMVRTFKYTQISQDVAKEMMAKDDDHVIVDVRREDEYAEGHIPGAILIPNESIGVDPFAGEGYDVPADLILMTHGHFDHTQTDTIATKNPDCETITWVEALSRGQHQSFDLGYVKVEAVEAGYNKNHDAKECVGFILTFSNGVTLYLSGDTSTTPQMKELSERNLDYAFFCCDGVYNMDVKEAIKCAKTVGAKHSIPYHMIPADKTNCFDQNVAESFDVPERIILRPGEELVLE
ncbi:MBL fold metallo-hydrolase [Butyrivibrio sp. AC2005]|uniref:MBL fold metallo-hydrolase n=1 Tax=Butyrivibrio sp. AC2005 TaxID=1280672 RepID=UPI0004790120|nr:MBL fold metallo-hydrolase [Butyrivibrio sp. AC2005]